MTLLARLLARLLRRLLGIAAEEVEQAMEPEEKPMPLSHKDSERQAAASRGPFVLTSPRAIDPTRPQTMLPPRPRR